MSPAHACSLKPSCNSLDTSIPRLCQAICIMTIQASHDRIFHPSASLLNSTRSSTKIISTVQNSFSPCKVQGRFEQHIVLPAHRDVPYISPLCPLYVSTQEATSRMLPSRNSLPKAWPTITPHFGPTSVLRDLKISAYGVIVVLLGHAARRSQAVYFIRTVGLDVFVVHHQLPLII